MITASRLRQTWTIASLQLRRVFFSRRSFWVYLLAIFPAVAFFGHALEVSLTRATWAAYPVTPASQLESLRLGERQEVVLPRLGEPARSLESEERTLRDGSRRPAYLDLAYYDGQRRWRLLFEDGELIRRDARDFVDFAEDRQVYAGIFEYFYLRLAIFFGCLGIFMNLFRGEMLDETLHFWFLVPARREVLLAGKYVAGLIAATVIFSTGAGLTYALMLWPQDAAELAAFWPQPGLSHLLAYCAAAALACVGYGSVFLAAGMLLRNPIVPAVVILFWEGINPFLPALLQKLSVLYYVRALTPVPAPMESDAPLLVQMLMAPEAPPSALVAVGGLLAVTALVLWAAAAAVRRLEIDYSTD